MFPNAKRDRGLSLPLLLHSNGIEVLCRQLGFCAQNALHGFANVSVPVKVLWAA